MFIKQEGDWTKLRTAGQAELDLHLTSPGRQYGPREMSYDQLMDAVHAKTLEALVAAYEEGKESLLVIHGHSTSLPGKRTSRSVVRALMRGKEATPYIVRKKCVRHGTAFLAHLKQKP